MPRWLGVAALAVALSSSIAPARADEVAAIRAVMLKTWDRPDNRLVIDPVVTREGHAVAGWTQGDLGGRALLRRDRTGAWVVWLCSGDSLKSAETLARTGIPVAVAHDLATALAQAEATLPSDRLERLARFEGTVLVAGDADHGAAHPHPGHPPHP